MIALRRLSPVSFWLLIAAALALRLAAPPGWMPVAESDGIRVALCSGGGATTALLDTGVPAKGSSEARDPCPYGLAGAAALDLPRLPELSLAPAALVLLFMPMLLAARLTAWRALRPPARGPPQFA